MGALDRLSEFEALQLLIATPLAHSIWDLPHRSSTMRLLGLSILAHSVLTNASGKPAGQIFEASLGPK